MGSSEMDKSSKEAKEAKEVTTPDSQEQASTAATGSVNPDWSGFQAYSPMPPHGFMASSPQAHPYMWGVQLYASSLECPRSYDKLRIDPSADSRYRHAVRRWFVVPSVVRCISSSK